MTPEEIVRDELKSLRDLSLRLAQWGVTVLAALQMVLYYVRNDVYARLLEAKAIQPGDLLPAGYYFTGTIFLVIVATIFTLFLYLLTNSYRYYRGLLGNEVSTTVAVPASRLSKVTRYLILLLFYVFPLIDILIRAWVKEVHIVIK
jgi:hypothetical protein